MEERARKRLKYQKYIKTEKEFKEYARKVCKYLTSQLIKYTEAKTKYDDMGIKEKSNNRGLVDYVEKIEVLINNLWNIWLMYGPSTTIKVGHRIHQITRHDQKENAWNLLLGQSKFEPNEKNWRLLCNQFDVGTDFFERLPKGVLDEITTMLMQNGGASFNNYLATAKYVAFNPEYWQITMDIVNTFVCNLLLYLTAFGHVAFYYKNRIYFVIHIYPGESRLFVTDLGVEDNEEHVNVRKAIIDNLSMLFKKSFSNTMSILNLSKSISGKSVQAVIDTIMSTVLDLFYNKETIKCSLSEIGFLSYQKYTMSQASVLIGGKAHSTKTSFVDRYDKFFTMNGHTLDPSMFHPCISNRIGLYIQDVNAFATRICSYITLSDIMKFCKSDSSKMRWRYSFMKNENPTVKDMGWFQRLETFSLGTAYEDAFNSDRSGKRLPKNVETSLTTRIEGEGEVNLISRYMDKKELIFIEESLYFSMLNDVTEFLE
jgi:hypothetical protein